MPKTVRRYGEPRRAVGGGAVKRSYLTAHKSYRQAVILMAKAGIGADAVRDMCHAELSAWFEDILSSLGIKTLKEEGVIVSKRLRKPEGK